MYKTICEEELKNKVASDYFSKYDSTPIIGNIDFCIALKKTKKSNLEIESLFWAEIKGTYIEHWK